METKFLTKEGLSYFWSHILSRLNSFVPSTRKINNKALTNDITINSTDISDFSSSVLKIVNSAGGGSGSGSGGAVNSVNGYIGDVVLSITDFVDGSGKLPSSVLPSYVDDVLEYSSRSLFPATGETGKIYLNTSNNLAYRWSGSTYVEISPSIALGTTSSTAYPGDKGAAAYAHAITNKGIAVGEGLYKITTNAEGHLTKTTAVTKKDITDLGISQDYLPLAGGTLTGALNINADAPAYWVRKNDSLIGGIRGLLDGNSQHRLALQQNASGSAYGEVYYLPVPNVLADGGKSYNILTTKSLVSIAQGGTGANSTLAASYNILKEMPEVTSVADSGVRIVCQYATPSAENGGIYFRSLDNIYAYINTKIEENYLSLAGGTLTGQLNIEPAGSIVPLRLKTSNVDVSSFASNVNQYAVQVMDANASAVGYSQIVKNTAGYVEYRHGAYLASAYNDTGANKTTYLYARVKKDGSTETGTNSIFYGAVWNDYAEFRITVPEVKPGQVVIENGDGTLSISTERLQAGCEVVSDTYGFAIGKTEKAETPIAVSGRVLAYTYEDRNTFVAGEPVCSGPNGTVSRMTREEVREYPERVIGTVSEIPEYETWGAEEVAVDGRIWIRIK